ncbi:hypothetical protein ACSQ67_016237 [Phaseolus vulgaris]
MQTRMVHDAMFLVVCCVIVHNGTFLVTFFDGGEGKEETTERAEVVSDESVKRREGAQCMECRCCESP